MDANYKELEAKSATSGKCPRCNGYFMRDRDEVFCINCGYRQLQDQPRPVVSAAAGPVRHEP